MVNSLGPLIVEIFTYIFVISGFTGLALVFTRKTDSNQSAVSLFCTGLVLYSVTFVLLRWSQLERATLLLFLFILTLIGYISLFQFLRANQKTFKRYMILIAALMGVYGLIYLVPLMIFGIDHQHYAIDMATSMNLNWLQSHDVVLGNDPVNWILRATHYNRAGVSSLGWLNNLSSISINPGTVQRHILFYLLLTLIRFSQIVFLRIHKPSTVLIAQRVPFFLILLGGHYLLSLLVGQLNAAIGIFLLLSLFLEIVQSSTHPWNSFTTLKLSSLSFLILVNYTELILMTPPLVILSFLYLETISVKHFFKVILSLSSSVTLVFIFKFSLFFNYLFGQGKAAVNFHPLGPSFSPTIFNTLSNIISSSESVMYGIFILSIGLASFILFQIYSIRTLSSLSPKQQSTTISHICLLWLFMIYYLVMTITALSLTANKNYMVFKLSSWTASLVALGLYIIWTKLTEHHHSKLLQASTLVITMIIALNSSYNSVRLLVNNVRDYRSHPSITFANSATPVFVRSRPEIAYGRTSVFYDPTWVSRLAAWKNLPIVLKNEKN